MWVILCHVAPNSNNHKCQRQADANIDVTVEMPIASVMIKDFLNNRYFLKR